MTPTSLGELYRSLELTLTVRPVDDEGEPAWACTLARPDGRAYEIESVTFFDVDPDTGEEWETEPCPSRVLGVLAGGVMDADDDDPAAAADAEAAARAFLGDESYELLLSLEEEGFEKGFE